MFSGDICDNVTIAKERENYINLSQLSRSMINMHEYVIISFIELYVNELRWSL